jgi:hypothetical protein
VELGRFVLLDDVPGNGETWFLARTFKMMREMGFLGIVSFSDPVQRMNRHGHLVFPGHLGIIYQAANAAYLGRSTPRTLTLLPDGQVFSDRAASKVRDCEQGVEYAVACLVRHGATPPPRTDDRFTLRLWLALWRPQLCRPLRHHGNHRYAWGLDRRVRLPSGSHPPKQPGFACRCKRCRRGYRPAGFSGLMDGVGDAGETEGRNG